MSCVAGGLFCTSVSACFEAVTHSVYGCTFALQADAQYWETLRNLSLVWSPQSDLSSQGQSQSQPLSVPLPAYPSVWYAGAAAALPHSSHMPTVSIFNQWELGVFPQGGSQAESGDFGSFCAFRPLLLQLDPLQVQLAAIVGFIAVLTVIQPVHCSRQSWFLCVCHSSSCFPFLLFSLLILVPCPLVLCLACVRDLCFCLH